MVSSTLLGNSVTLQDSHHQQNRKISYKIFKGLFKSHSYLLLKNSSFSLNQSSYISLSLQVIEITFQLGGGRGQKLDNVMAILSTRPKS